MRSRSTLSLACDGKNAIIAIVIVLILIASSVGAFMLLSQEDRTVKAGDTVTVNYIGKLEDGRVFDTSIHSVAVDNETYPKSLTFIYRGNATVYEPFDFTVASPDAVNKEVIDGFNDGVLGMKKEETKEIVVPVGEGYTLDESKLITLNLTQSIAVQRTMGISAFGEYFGSTPVSFMLYTDPVYKWDVQVLFVDDENVMIQNIIPNGGADYKAYSISKDDSYGWQINATYDNTGNITVRHLLDASSALNVKGLDYDNSIFFIESVDAANGTAVMNYDREVAGKVITFIVTVLSIT